MAKDRQLSVIFMTKKRNFCIKMQDLGVSTFINQQPLALKHLLNALRVLILQAGPYVEETIKYNIPFYNYQGRLCFLNTREGGVELGFFQGAFLANEQGLLVGEGKEVRHVRIKSLAHIDQEAIQALLQEAMLLNEVKKKRQD